MRVATGRTLLFVLVGACASRATVETSSPPAASSASTPTIAPPIDASTPDAEPEDAAAAVPIEVHPLEKDAIDGPHEELSLEAGRSIWYALPKDAGVGAEPRGKPLRLIGHIHGVCGPPSYACGKWIGAGTAVGFMVCPTGNAKCGDSPMGPPSWSAPTWVELVDIMDHDLESSIAKVAKKRRDAFTREGAILTGYSRGAFAAPSIAKKHPGQWRHLVLIEANVPLSATSLRTAGVKSVALVAGEQGDQIQGMRKSEAALNADGVPTKLFVMKKTGHPYSTDMEDVMSEALTFVLGHDSD